MGRITWRRGVSPITARNGLPIVSRSRDGGRIVAPGLGGDNLFGFAIRTYSRLRCIWNEFIREKISAHSLVATAPIGELSVQLLEDRWRVGSGLYRLDTLLAPWWVSDDSHGPFRHSAIAAALFQKPISRESGYYAERFPVQLFEANVLRDNGLGYP